jgi:integrase
MSQIKAAHVNRFREDLKRTNTPRSANRTLQNVKTFISWAFEMGYIASDFSRQVKKMEEPKARRGYLEPDEVIKLAALHWKDLRVKAAVCLALFAGLRKGEIRALRWRNIDFEKLTISVEENFTDDYDENRNPIFKHPKAESNRRFPYLIFDELKNILLQLYTDTPFKSTDDLCLVNVWGIRKAERQGEKIPDRPHTNAYELRQYQPMSGTAIKRDFSLMLEAIGISTDQQHRRKIVFHSLRHSFTSLMSVVAPMSAVMGLTGHESAAAFNGYRHTIQSAATEALTAANEYLNQFRAEQVKPERPGGIH